MSLPQIHEFSFPGLTKAGEETFRVDLAHFTPDETSRFGKSSKEFHDRVTGLLHSHLYATRGAVARVAGGPFGSRDVKKLRELAATYGLTLDAYVEMLIRNHLKNHPKK